MENLTNIQDKLSKLISKRELLKEQIHNKIKEKETLNLKLIDLKEVQAIFQKAAQTTQENLSFHIETIVSQALATVFDDPYEFRARFVSRRNVSECDLFFFRDGLELDPLEGCGYGSADIASLALRIAYWKLSTSRNSLILDEPLRNLSKDKQSLASFMLKEISKQLDLQILIISHNQELTEYADKIFEVTQINGVSNIKEKNHD